MIKIQPVGVLLLTVIKNVIVNVLPINVKNTKIKKLVTITTEIILLLFQKILRIWIIFVNHQYVEFGMMKNLKKYR